MVINRPFLSALVFSVLWHIIWIISINVVVLPSNFLFIKNTDVSFLGSFLNEIFVERLELKEADLQFSKKLKPSYMLETPKIEEAVIPPEISLPSYKDIINEKDFFTDTNPFIKKVNPEYAFISDNIPAQTENNLIGGDAGLRLLTAKQPFPIYSSINKNFKGVFDVDIEFLVTPDGEVYFPKVMYSSGYFDIDQLAIGYTRHLKFNPLSLNQKQIDQKGLIKVVISPDR
jgi:hypothetical protein